MQRVVTEINLFTFIILFFVFNDFAFAKELSNTIEGKNFKDCSMKSNSLKPELSDFFGEWNDTYHKYTFLFNSKLNFEFDKATSGKCNLLEQKSDFLLLNCSVNINNEERDNIYVYMKIAYNYYINRDIKGKCYKYMYVEMNEDEKCLIDKDKLSLKKRKECMKYNRGFNRYFSGYKEFPIW